MNNNTISERSLNESLNQALETGNSEQFFVSLRDLVYSRSTIIKTAKKSGLTRVGLYKILSKEGNPSFSNVLSILKSMGIKIRLNLFDHSCLSEKKGHDQ